MTRKLIRSPALYAGVPYSYAAIAPAGSTVFTAGACPIDSEGRVVALGDVASQTRHTLNNLLAALRAAGCGLEDVVKTTVYVPSSERSDLLAAWEVVELLRQRRTAEHAPRGQRPRVRRPARTGRGGRRPRLSERQDARGSRSSALQSREVSRETRIGIVVAALAVSAMAVDHLIEDGGGVPADLGGFRVHRGLVAGASGARIRPRRAPAKASPVTVERAAKAGFVCSLLAVLALPTSPWLGVPIVLGGGGIALGG